MEQIIDPQILIGLAIGIAGYACLYLGKGIQKYAINGLQADRTVKSKHSGIWIFGCVLTVLAMFVQWAALKFAPINTIASLEGMGLIVLLVFSFYVLKESISKIEIKGVILIIIGTALVALFNTNASDVAVAFLRLDMLPYCVALVVVELILIFISKSNGYKYGGLAIGFTAGTFMAFQTLSKRLSFLQDYQLVFSVLVIVLAGLTFLFTQFGFTKAKANQVLPCFASASVIIATLAGMLVLNEALIPVQLVGIIGVVVGVIFLTAYKKENPEKGGA